MLTNLSDAAKAVLFYVIALSLAGAVAASTSMWGGSTPHVTMLTPAIAVLVMTTLVTNDGRHRDAWASLGLHKVGLNGWPFAIGVPVLVLGGTYAVTWISGLAEMKAPVFSGSLKFVLVAFVGLAFSTFFAMGEEIGWRGYMLPRLKTIGVFRAMLVVGFLQGVWHLPIMLATPWYHSSGNKFIVVPLFLVTLTLAGILLGYLRFTTDSVWPCAIAHATYKCCLGYLDRVHRSIIARDARICRRRKRDTADPGAFSRGGMDCFYSSHKCNFCIWGPSRTFTAVTRFSRKPRSTRHAMESAG